MPTFDSRPRLVATLGPASFDLCLQLLRAGATDFRLNASHLSSVELRDALGMIRRASTDVPVVVDLQGAKMRLGEFASRAVSADEILVFRPGSQAQGAIPVPHPELFRSVRPGDTLACNDGKLLLRVEKATLDRLDARALNAGEISRRKGINVLDHPVGLDDLNDMGIAQVDASAACANVGFAISFMCDGLEAQWVRRRVTQAKVVGKIERVEATRNLALITDRVDEVWICRGDLGAQLGMGSLARWVAGFDPRKHPVATLMAGQVLEHLTEHAGPTRSEVCHLYDVLHRGYAGIVLSDETAIGRDPVNAVEVAARLLQELL